MENMRHVESKVLNTLGALPSAGTVAVYTCEGVDRVISLPIPTKELVVAGDRPHLKPLFRLLQRRQPFWIAQFETEFTRLLWSDGFELQVRRTFAPIKNGIKWNLELLHRLESFVGRDADPILLAGNDSFCTFARMSLWHLKIMDRELIGDTKRLDCQQLMNHASEVVDRHFKLHAEAKTNWYLKEKMLGFSTTKIENIIDSLLRHDIRHLFLASNINIWGSISWTKSQFEIHQTQSDAHDNDILGLLAQKAYQFGIPFTLLDLDKMPENAPFAAILKHSDHVAQQLHILPNLAFPFLAPQVGPMICTAN